MVQKLSPQRPKGIFSCSLVVLGRKASHRFLNQPLQSVVEDVQPSSTDPAVVPLPAEVIHPPLQAAAVVTVVAMAICHVHSCTFSSLLFSFPAYLCLRSCARARCSPVKVRRIYLAYVFSVTRRPWGRPGVARPVPLHDPPRVRVKTDAGSQY